MHGNSADAVLVKGNSFVIIGVSVNGGGDGGKDGGKNVLDNR